MDIHKVCDGSELLPQPDFSTFFPTIQQLFQFADGQLIKLFRKQVQYAVCGALRKADVIIPRRGFFLPRYAFFPAFLLSSCAFIHSLSSSDISSGKVRKYISLP